MLRISTWKSLEIGILTLCLLCPGVSSAGKPKSDLYFLFVHLTDKLDRETGEFIYEVEKKVKINDIAFESDPKVLHFNSDKNYVSGSQVSTIKLVFALDELAKEKKALYENAPASLTFVSEKWTHFPTSSCMSKFYRRTKI
jgi:hypothetical protein